MAGVDYAYLADVGGTGGSRDGAPRSGDCGFILLRPEGEQALRQLVTARSNGTCRALFAVQPILESLRNGRGEAV